MRGINPSLAGELRLVEPDPNQARRAGLEIIPAAKVAISHPLPLFNERVPCGFGSPAEGYILKSLDLQDLCIKDPPATFFIRAGGRSMVEDRIFPGDYLIVEKALSAPNGKKIIGVLDGKFTCKRIYRDEQTGRVTLMPANKRMAPIELHDGQELEVWGTVEWIFHPA